MFAVDSDSDLRRVEGKLALSNDISSKHMVEICGVIQIPLSTDVHTCIRHHVADNLKPLHGSGRAVPEVYRGVSTSLRCHDAPSRDDNTRNLRLLSTRH